MGEQKGKYKTEEILNGKKKGVYGGIDMIMERGNLVGREIGAMMERDKGEFVLSSKILDMIFFLTPRLETPSSIFASYREIHAICHQRNRNILASRAARIILKALAYT